MKNNSITWFRYCSALANKQCATVLKHRLIQHKGFTCVSFPVPALALFLSFLFASPLSLPVSLKHKFYSSAPPIGLSHSFSPSSSLCVIDDLSRKSSANSISQCHPHSVLLVLMHASWDGNCVPHVRCDAECATPIMLEPGGNSNGQLRGSLWVWSCTIPSRSQYFCAPNAARATSLNSSAPCWSISGIRGENSPTSQGRLNSSLPYPGLWSPRAH